MKTVLLVLMVILIFFACAVFGYNLANISDSLIGEKPATPTPTEIIQPGSSEQHNLVFIQVDQLDAPTPRLVSVWFVSLYFLEGTPPTLTFAQLYSLFSTRDSAKNIEDAFSLNARGEPSTAFWKAVSVYDIQWEGYFIVDQVSIQQMLAWLNGPGDFTSPFNSVNDTRELLMRSCQAIPMNTGPDRLPFDWSGVIPTHFRSSLDQKWRAAYWNRVAASDQPVACDVIMAP